MAMFVDFVASTAVEIAVNGGAITISAWVRVGDEWAEGGEEGAGLGQRLVHLPVPCHDAATVAHRELRVVDWRTADPSPRWKPVGIADDIVVEDGKVVICLLVGEGFDAGEFCAAQEFEGGAAAGGDVRDLVRNAGLVNGCDGVAASND